MGIRAWSERRSCFTGNSASCVSWSFRSVGSEYCVLLRCETASVGNFPLPTFRVTVVYFKVREWPRSPEDDTALCRNVCSRFRIDVAPCPTGTHSFALIVRSCDFLWCLLYESQEARIYTGQRGEWVTLLRSGSNHCDRATVFPGRVCVDENEWGAVLALF